MITVREFMTKKFPTNKWMQCPISEGSWETIQEYAEEYARQVAEAVKDECRKRIECFDIAPEVITNINVEDFIK